MDRQKTYLSIDIRFKFVACIQKRLFPKTLFNFKGAHALKIIKGTMFDANDGRNAFIPPTQQWKCEEATKLSYYQFKIQFLMFYKKAKTNIENSWNWFLVIYVCYILKQEPYQYMYFPSRYGSICKKHAFPPLHPLGGRILQNHFLKDALRQLE